MSRYLSAGEADHDAEDDVHRPAKRARFTARVEDATDAFTVTQVDETAVFTVDTATPQVAVAGAVAVGDTLYLRSDSHLYAIRAE